MNSNAKVDSQKISPLLMRLLKRVFTDQISQILDVIVKLPVQALEWLLNKFRMKKETQTYQKQEQNKQWRDICEKNFHKSLDHRSFYFKQCEKKNTNFKSFFGEIKDRHYQKLCDQTPLCVKKGGSPDSIYYNSLPGCKPEIFHTTLQLGDEIGQMTDVYFYYYFHIL